jgi:hypothetical protein
MDQAKALSLCRRMACLDRLLPSTSKYSQLKMKAWIRPRMALPKKASMPLATL